MTVEEFLDEAETKADSADPVSLTIRELVAVWGLRRRGYRVVERIKRDLKRRGLTTLPPFEDDWIDTRVSIVRRDRAHSDGQRVPAAHVPPALVDAAKDPVPVSLKVGSLQ